MIRKGRKGTIKFRNLIMPESGTDSVSANAFMEFVLSPYTRGTFILLKNSSGRLNKNCGLVANRFLQLSGATLPLESRKKNQLILPA